MKKVISILAVILITVATSVTLAFTPFSVSDVAPEGMEPMARSLLGLIQYAGYGIAIGMLIYLGIKYTMSSADAKADVKKDSINYLIGAIIIIAAVTLFRAIISFAERANTNGGGGGSNSYPSSYGSGFGPSGF